MDAAEIVERAHLELDVRVAQVGEATCVELDRLAVRVALSRPLGGLDVSARGVFEAARLIVVLGDVFGELPALARRDLVLDPLRHQPVVALLSVGDERVVDRAPLEAVLEEELLLLREQRVLSAADDVLALE